MDGPIYSAAMNADSNGLFATLDAEIKQSNRGFFKHPTTGLRLRSILGWLEDGLVSRKQELSNMSRYRIKEDKKKALDASDSDKWALSL